MGFYALYYYQRAAGLRPYDPKMWQAVGSCYAKMDRVDPAIKALKRALAAGTYFETESPVQSFNAAASIASNTGKSAKAKSSATGRKLLDPETLFSIASLYERLGIVEETAKYMDLCVAQETGATAKSVSNAEKLMRKRQMREAKRAQMAAERRARAANVGDMDMDTADPDGEDGDGDTEILSELEERFSPEPASDVELEGEVGGGDGFGTGTTATTSKARLWLARHALKEGEMEKAERLAEELCQDGFEVEEAKGLVREVRGRRAMDE